MGHQARSGWRAAPHFAMVAGMERETATAKGISMPLPSSGSAGGPAYLPTLDGWRAIAVVGVLVFHSRDALQAAGWESSKVLAFFIRESRRGVELFFAISGFLICNRLLREMRLRGGISLWGFYVRRAFRILPLYLFYLAALWRLAQWAGLPASEAELQSCLLFYRNYVDPVPGAYTNHFWSLALEEHFYLGWPLFLLLAGARRARWLTPALALALAGWRGVDNHFHVFARLFPHAAGMLSRTDTRGDCLLWGCFAALVCFERDIRLPGWAPFAAMGLCVAALVVPFPSIFLAMAVLFPLLIVSTIFCPGGVAGRFLEWPVLRWVGQLSYSLYVWQTLFLQSEAAVPDPGWLVPLKHWPWNYACIVALALATHYFIELPLIRLGRSCQRRTESHPLPQAAIP